MSKYYIIEQPKGLEIWAKIKELKSFHELIYFLAWRNVKVKYKDAILGVLWAVLKPLFFMVVLTFVLKRGLNLSTNGIPSSLFYFIGLVYWSLFTGIVGKCTNVAISSSGLYKSVYFPKLVLPISVVISEFFDFALGLIVLIVMVFIFMYNGLDINVFNWLLTTFLAILASLWGAFSVGLWVSALNVKYRDIQHLVPFVLRVLFFMTPILYPVRAFAGTPWAGYILAINPMTGALNIARAAFARTGIDWTIVTISLVSTLILFVLGLRIFIIQERDFADIA